MATQFIGVQEWVHTRKCLIVRHICSKGRRVNVLRSGLHFQEWDVLEVDHIIPRALSGKDEYNNLQLLHRHCHDEKTRDDLIEIRKKETSNILSKIGKFLSNFDWGWINDIPIFLGFKTRQEE